MSGDPFAPAPIVPVVSCAIVSAGRLLLLKRRYPPAAGRWGLPAGHVEPMESAEEAIRREVAEETGLTLAPAYRTSWGRLGEDGRHYLGMLFTAEVGEVDVRLDHESLDWRWCALRADEIEAVDWAFPSHRDAARALARERGAQ